MLAPIYALTASYDTIQSNDPRSAALAGWTLAATGDLAFDDRWPEEAISWGVEGRDGRLYSNRFPGVIATAAVAYWIAIQTGAVPSEALPHPYDVPIWPATVAAILIAVLAAAVTYRVFRELPVSRWTAVVAGAFVALGTPLWSVSADALWTHGATHALLLLTVLALARDREVTAAVLAALVVAWRPHLIVPVLVLAFLARSWPRRALVVAGGALGLAALALYSYGTFGQPLPAAGYNVEGLTENAPLTSLAALAGNFADWLVQPGRGVLIFVPVLLVAMPEIVRAWCESEPWVRVAALAGAAYAFTQLSLIRAGGGTFFYGHRTTIEALVLAAPLLLLALRAWWMRGALAQVVLAGTIALSIVIHTQGALSGMSDDSERRLRHYQERTGPQAAFPGEFVGSGSLN